MANKKKFVKLGVVMDGDKGPFIVLGNSKAKKAEYNFNVEVRVTDLSGNKTAYTKNGILSLFDPRKRPGASEADIARVPKKIKYDLMLVVEEE